MYRMWWERPWCGAVAVVLISVTASCGWLSEGPRVLVVGDSITGLVADDYARSDDGDYRYTLRATNGATTSEMLEAARDVSDVDFSEVIVNLGTNDGLKNVPPEETTAALGELLALYDGADCIHLTTLNEEAISFEDPGVGERMAAINAHLRALADEHDDIDLIDWNATLRDREGEAEDGSLLVDSVHPTAAGQRLLRELSVNALGSCS
jgi:lysophospholipase L1-like esterase